MLCGNDPTSSIMSNIQMMSGSFLPVSFSSLYGPSFSPSWKPCDVHGHHLAAVRREVGDAVDDRAASWRCPGTASRWRGPTTACRTSPATGTRRSSRGTPSARRDRRACFGSRTPSLFVPMMHDAARRRRDCRSDCEPSSATHFTFLPVLTSHVVGRPVSVRHHVAVAACRPTWASRRRRCRRVRHRLRGDA